MDLIAFQDYSFTYPQMGQAALKHISFSVHAGEFLLVCGKSGCGKSTLLRQLKNSLRPYGKIEGGLLYENQILAEMDLRSQSQDIGFVMQNPDSQIVTDKVWHELAFGLESLGYSTETIRLRVAEMASYFGIGQWFYKNTEELSGGQKQLLNLASVMAMHPSLLILDEPTSQLDPIAAADFLATLVKLNRELGTTIVMTEHRLEEIFPSADRVLVMKEGAVQCLDTPRKTGMFLHEQKDGMFLAMPAPMQIYAAFESDTAQCPLTVREGRAWLQSRNLKPQEEKIEHSEKETPYILEMKEIWFRYKKEEPDILKGLNLKIKKGEWYCLMGGNGSGKSTTVSVMCRLLHPYQGKVLWDGKALDKWKDKELYRGFLGVVPQNPQSLFVKKTVEEELYEMTDGRKENRRKEFLVDIPKEEAIKGMAKLTHLTHLLKHHPYDLSGGEQQRLALAKILLLRPEVLLLDEPTKGLDADYKEEFAEILKQLGERGVTIIMISHDIEFCARYADRCGLFFDGQVVSENVPEVFFSENTFYTTMANRMARQYRRTAITVESVVRYLKDENAGQSAVPSEILRSSASRETRISMEESCI